MYQSWGPCLSFPQLFRRLLARCLHVKRLPSLTRSNIETFEAVGISCNSPLNIPLRAHLSRPGDYGGW